MMVIPDKGLNNDEITWIHQHIDSQRFYIHSKYGGIGWLHERTNNGWQLTIEDDELALLFLLKFGK